MISPYDEIIRSVSAELTLLAFHLAEDRSHGMTFQRAQFSLDFSSERYRHPSLLSLLGYPVSNETPKSQIHVATLMRHFAPQRFSQLRANFEHDSYAGLRAALQYEMKFLKDFERDVFAEPPQYFEACRALEIQDLRNAGFRVDDYGI